LVLVIGSLGRWGRGKTMTLTMLQELTKNEPEALEFKKPQVIVSNFLSKFMDYYVAIKPAVKELNNKFTGKKVPVLDLFEFLNRPVGDVEYFMFLDDVYAWLASYYFGNAFNQAAFRLLAAGRKKGISIGESSVRFKDVDPRLRALHTHLFLPKFSQEEGMVKIERYAVDVFEDVRLYPDLYYDASRYYDAYDTKEIIESVYDAKQQAAQAIQIQPRQYEKPAHAINSAPAPAPAAPIAIPQFNYITPTKDRASQGLRNREKGNLWQHVIVEEIKRRFYRGPEFSFDESPEEAGRGVMIPDLIVRKNGVPIAVYAIKSCEVVPYAQRRQPDGSWKNNAITYHDKDLRPEISAAVQFGLPLHLYILNTLNMKVDDHVIENPSTFKVYTTTSELARPVDAKPEGYTFEPPAVEKKAA
jgi:hypothetical protein